jgi:crotonobetainyl-CoA:carnitine CoA-transferase CaiB-like acyl-CoA transferase
MNPDHEKPANHPLAGLKVVELARILAGPFAGQILADLGAEVIKVESPEGDDTRQWGPPWIDRNDGSRDAAYFHACNRGKQGVIADFCKAGDLAFVKELCRDADVVIENFKTGTLAKYGLDHASLAASNPRLVYCSITGFGHTGPYAHRPGYDFVIQAMSGFMSLTGVTEGEPMKMGLPISDLLCGLYSTIAIQAALAMRERTGLGQHIDMALLDCSVAALANQGLYQMTTGSNPPRMGNAHAQVAPYQVFPVSDGHLILAPGNDEQFRKLARLLDRPDLAADERLASNGGRLENRDWMVAELAQETSRFTKADLMAACEAAGVPFGPINRLDEVFADPQVEARAMLVDLPDGLKGIRSPFTFSGAELALNVPSPTIGQHHGVLRGDKD